VPHSDLAEAALLATTGPMRLFLLALLLALAVLAGAVVARRGRVGSPEGRMGSLGHLEELRRRLLACALALILGIAFAFSFRWVPWRGLWVPEPAVVDPMAAQTFRRAAQDAVPEGVRLITVGPLDAFMAEFWIAVGLGILWALPAILAQAGAFVGPALRPRERRILVGSLAPAVGLFLLGAAFAYLWVLPVTLRTLYAYADPLGAVPYLGLSEFASFTFGFLLAFGLAFQIPLILYVLARVGLFRWRSGVRYWRHATVAIVVLSASLTPDASPVTLALLAVPLGVLYAAGLGLAWLGGRRFEATASAR